MKLKCNTCGYITKSVLTEFEMKFGANIWSDGRNFRINKVVVESCSLNDQLDSNVCICTSCKGKGLLEKQFSPVWICGRCETTSTGTLAYCTYLGAPICDECFANYGPKTCKRCIDTRNCHLRAKSMGESITNSTMSTSGTRWFTAAQDILEAREEILAEDIDFDLPDEFPSDEG